MFKISYHPYSLILITITKPTHILYIHPFHPELWFTPKVIKMPLYEGEAKEFNLWSRD